LYAREVTDTRLIPLIGPVCLILRAGSSKKLRIPGLFPDQFDPSGKGIIVGLTMNLATETEYRQP
jgi:hypothetical protein